MPSERGACLGFWVRSRSRMPTGLWHSCGQRDSWLTGRREVGNDTTARLFSFISSPAGGGGGRYSPGVTCWKALWSCLFNWLPTSQDYAQIYTQYIFYTLMKNWVVSKCIYKHFMKTFESPRVVCKCNLELPWSEFKRTVFGTWISRFKSKLFRSPTVSWAC